MILQEFLYTASPFDSVTMFYIICNNFINIDFLHAENAVIKYFDE